MENQEKKTISTAEFEKRVEIEAANLMYFDRMKKEESFNKARREISARFVADDNL